MFEIQAEHLHGYRQARQLLPDPREVQDMFGPMNSQGYDMHEAGHNGAKVSLMTSDGPAIEFARCFLRLANLANFALDRLSRYEATLWRQAGRILYALEVLDRRKPQERSRRSVLAAHMHESNIECAD